MVTFKDGQNSRSVRYGLFPGFLILLATLVSTSGCRITHQKKGVKMVNGMEFQSFTLKNNLQVLTISHKDFVKSSASLAVQAGSMDNPKEHLGLAHFLEHLLFLGTKEFPKVGDYENYLNTNGGGHNAYTSIDHTNYFFDINHVGFEGGLERFSRFFVSPTFDANYVAREKEAVNSEHEKNRKEDSRREYRMQQILSDPSHPFSKFATGDKNTLANAGQKEVREFYEKHYSSNLMRLVLMSNVSSIELKKLAEAHFSDIPDRKLPTPIYGENLFPKDQLPRKAHLKTIREKNSLKISFDTPDELPYWETKPLQFISHIVGDEGEGSLLSLLKKEGLALGLSTSSWWRTFNVAITLTDKGKGNIELILQYFYAYIDKLKSKGLDKYIFDERRQLAEVEFENIEPKSSMGRASEFSSAMLYYPVESFLQRYYLYHKYSNEDFQKFISYVRPENMQILVFVDQLNPPKPNPFVPTDFSMISHAAVQTPVVIKDNKIGTLYSQVDTQLGVPKASLSLNFVSDSIKGDPKTYVTAQLYAIAKRQELNEWGYPARLAGIHYGVSHGNNTVSVEASGYNQHLEDFIKKLIVDEGNSRRIDHVVLSDDLFEKIKKKYKQGLFNADFDAAYQVLLYENSKFVNTGGVHRDLYKNLIDEVTMKDVNAFAKTFFSKVAIRGLSYGNISADRLKGAADFFRKKITTAHITDEEVETFENKFTDVLNLSGRLEFTGKNNNNSNVNFYPMATWNIRNQARIEILGKLIEQPFFTELRTNQQLGYIVAAFATTSNGYCGFGTLIQSQSHEADDIYKRSHSFITEFIDKLGKELSDDKIGPIKESLIQQYKKKPNSIHERMSQFSHLAGTYHGDFDFIDKIVSSLESINTAELKKFLADNFIKEKPKGHLSLFYFGTDAKSKTSKVELAKIEDPSKEKASRSKIQPYKLSKGMTGKLEK